MMVLHNLVSLPEIPISKVCKTSSDIEVDRISSLPKNIIDSILSLLEIKEAARTSILSRSWRYQWHSLLKIEIRSESFPFHSDQLQVSRAVYSHKIVKIINDIFLVHCGSVEKFELDVNLEVCTDIDRWILYVSRNGIKELIIRIWSEYYYVVPPSIFSCYDLRNLHLKRCIFDHPPAAFKAFSNLTELVFELVVISDEGLEKILNSCPLLSRLSLLDVSPYPSLKINAPNLVMLHIEGFHCYSQFFNKLPRLTSATFGLDDDHVYSPIVDDQNCTIVQLLGAMPVLQQLVFDFYAFQHVVSGNVPVCLPFVCPIVYLSASINFEDLQELLVAFCIFRSSPCISHLELWCWLNEYTSVVPADGFLSMEHDFGFKFDHLKRVDVYLFHGFETELKFFKYLLANAPVLEEMYVECSGGSDSQESEDMVTKLIQFPRASPNVEFV